MIISYYTVVSSTKPQCSLGSRRSSGARAYLMAHPDGAPLNIYRMAMYGSDGLEQCTNQISRCFLAAPRPPRHRRDARSMASRAIGSIGTTASSPRNASSPVGVRRPRLPGGESPGRVPRAAPLRRCDNGPNPNPTSIAYIYI